MNTIRHFVILPLLSIMVLCCTKIASTQGAKTVKYGHSTYVGGDGGPMVLLQASAATKWQGATDSENSKMNGGNRVTDYDVICARSDYGYPLKRYERTMLVLADSEWGAYIRKLPSGAIVIVQQFLGDQPVDHAIIRVAPKRPSKSFSFHVQDPKLRLLVGADDGKGSIYGYHDVSITPGKKICKVYTSREEMVIVITRP